MSSATALLWVFAKEEALEREGNLKLFRNDPRQILVPFGTKWSGEDDCQESREPPAHQRRGGWRNGERKRRG